MLQLNFYCWNDRDLPGECFKHVYLVFSPWAKQSNVRGYGDGYQTDPSSW